MIHPFPIFIGYDARESVSFHVLSHSIRKHSSIPVSITPLDRNTLWPIFTRNRGTNESTDFAFSRFLVPYLCHYKGFALFMDCDMLMRGDVAEIAAMCNHVNNFYYGAFCVKHDYESIVKEKFLGAVNEPYPRKNWSSVILFNNQRCRKLTPEAVNEATGPYLHRFGWLKDEEIGDLPRSWNHLVDEYAPDPFAKLLHFTLGGPYFPEYDGCEGSDEWWQSFMEMIHAETSGLVGKGEELRMLARGEGRVALKFNPEKLIAVN
jgi:hypothetical protein